MNFANNHKDNVIKAVLIFAVLIVSFLSWRSTVALWGGGESTDIMQKEDATTITKCMVWVLHKHYRDLCTGPIDDQTRYYEISKAFFYFLTTQYAEGFFSRDIDDAVIEGLCTNALLKPFFLVDFAA